MLLLLFILAIGYSVSGLLTYGMVKKGNLGTIYQILAMIQSACSAASLVILAITLILGRTIS
ncbi:hypothetical protein M2139_002047 [Enterococcus sp. PF1-24]|uniref:hypothetical protein n=1 Tax=unclassified Enterococcus TaxID=2608891 RepID=UPI00247602FB|nr:MULTISPECIES: hypothetical protein [unclassified Enterococcus]MDH6365080.1 hypothetical protein [Enterococcus sp. PFB1-1]MDH6402147.1 hypothetical protein [Enterococcus sp. PF1-24]